MAQHYVYSTLSSPQAYTIWRKTESDLPLKEHTVHIAGGANVTNAHFLTPKGVLTIVEEAEMEQLLNCDMFQRHVERGFIRIEAKEAKVDAVAADMTAKDASAPATAEDFKVNEDGTGAPILPASKTKKSKG